jgi:hypothetical protein
MEIINHRVNSVLQLKECRSNEGAEIDVRYHNDCLIISHDPYHSDNNITLDEYLKNFSLKGTLILNIKSEGIESECIRILKRHHILNWFFLDLSIPQLVRISNNLEAYNITKHNLCVRFSDYEPLDFTLSFSGKVGWVWVDRFAQSSLGQDTFNLLKEHGFKICLVSPELHGDNVNLKEYREEMMKFKIDAVCTKSRDYWG